jgi:signal transduction histidine kinase
MGVKVLVAEDSAVMRRLLLASLSKWEYDVAEAENGQQAWELFQGDDFPLVLTDWMMPEMDGMELIRRIRSHDLPAYVYIILLTAKSEKADLIAAMEAGADDFLAKPVDQGELRARLREGERIIRLERTLVEQNRQLRETQAALVQSEKLASLGQLAAGMAHEINNPISYVANNLAVLKRDVLSVLEVLEMYRQAHQQLSGVNPPLAARIAELEQECELAWVKENLPRLFETSLQGVGRVRDIVKNLRDFARLDEAEFDQLDLNAALESTVEILQHELAEKQIRLEKCFQPLPPVDCRPGKIYQVLHSLLWNAIQASEPNRIIWLRTMAGGEAVVVEVEDQGCGIDAAHLSRIFEPFFTTKPVGHGAGLGLTISYGIVRDHGGSIEVKSELTRGSVFRVRLPVQPPRKH